MKTIAKIRDLRDWLNAVAEIGQLKKVAGAHWNLELGAISELNYQSPGYSALLFDRIPDSDPGFRILTGASGTAQRTGITFNLGIPESDMELVGALRGKPLLWEAAAHQYPPLVVTDGPVFQNTWTGNDIDLFRLPSPQWRDLDGGRYLGTGCACITRDLDDPAWVNIGTYRGMVVDRDKMTLEVTLGKHGALILQKWYERHGRAPMAVSLGHHPLLSLLAGLEVTTGLSEYAFAGSIQGEPVAVVLGPVTGLPIPAHAEIVLEGFLEPDKVAKEGPLGEWTGYYSGTSVPVPYLQVEAVHFRHQPIIIGSPPGLPPHDFSYMRTVLKSAMIFDALVKAGAPEIKAVWTPECGGGRMLVIVSITQRYTGHAKQVGLLATSLHAATYMNRLVIVVDDDIDPTNLEQVMWSVCTRCEPVQDVQILSRMWGSQADPMLESRDQMYNSRMVIDACIPFERRDSFPPVARSRPELLRTIGDKWRWLWD